MPIVSRFGSCVDIGISHYCKSNISQLEYRQNLILLCHYAKPPNPYHISCCSVVCLCKTSGNIVKRTIWLFNCCYV